jgi:hypothetical protein
MSATVSSVFRATGRRGHAGSGDRRRLAAAAASGRRPGRPAARLTRRGQRVVGTLLVLAVGGLTAMAAVPGRAAESAVERPVVVVAAGDTLWGIAARCVGARDRFLLIDQIRQLNGLPDSQVEVGRRLELPCRQLRPAR